MLTDMKRDIELWNGRQVVGHIRLHPDTLKGLHTRLSFAPSPLKALYNKRYEEITLPIIYRCISDDGVDYTIRRCFDVRHKSKRQIKMLCEYDSSFW